MHSIKIPHHWLIRHQTCFHASTFHLSQEQRAHFNTPALDRSRSGHTVWLQYMTSSQQTGPSQCPPEKARRQEAQSMHHG
eukprot:6007159-Alexandrium_andersonii.AAC.1